MESVEKYTTDEPTIEKMGISAHGIDLYSKEFDNKFYNSYLP